MMKNEMNPGLVLEKNEEGIYEEDQDKRMRREGL